MKFCLDTRGRRLLSLSCHEFWMLHKLQPDTRKVVNERVSHECGHAPKVKRVE